MFKKPGKKRLIVVKENKVYILNFFMYIRNHFKRLLHLDDGLGFCPREKYLKKLPFSV